MTQAKHLQIRLVLERAAKLQVGGTCPGDLRFHLRLSDCVFSLWNQASAPDHTHPTSPWPTKGNHTLSLNVGMPWACGALPPPHPQDPTSCFSRCPFCSWLTATTKAPAPHLCLPHPKGLLKTFKVMSLPQGSPQPVTSWCVLQTPVLWLQLGIILNNPAPEHTSNHGGD